MRFSIRPAGFCKCKAEIGGAAMVIRQRLWPLRFSSGEWHWTWPDATRMTLTYKRQNYRYVRHELLADGVTVCHALVRVPLFSNWRWEETVWKFGARRLTHRRVPRRATSWRGMFAVMPRHVLNDDTGRTPASWSDDCRSHSWQGVLRSSLDEEVKRAVFGIVVALCLLEQSGDAAE